jgi:hypothetical protein
MPDCVLDASVIAFANGDLTGRRSGNLLDRRLRIVEEVAQQNRRVRYNNKLLTEYQRLVTDYRNDAIELFFAVLDSEHSVLVRRSTLSRQHHRTATGSCRWPSHDQHLLAAAVGGEDPSVFVTESRLATCAPQVLSHFSVHVVLLA